MATRNVVFLIHGIGREGADWAKGPLAELQKAAALSAAFKKRKLDQQIQFIPIVYNDIFDLVLERWQTLAQDLEKFGALLPAAIGTLKDVIKEISTKGNALAEYAGDTILYAGFKLVRNAVLLRVISKIVEGISAAYAIPGPKPRIGVVAHSLGTAVAHDALHLLATLPWATQPAVLSDMKSDVDLLRKTGNEGNAIADGILDKVGNDPAAPSRFRFDSIFMIANTGRLLYTTDRGPYESCIHPALPTFPDPGYCDAFYDVDNRYDVVTIALKAVGCAFETDNPQWRDQGIVGSDTAADVSLEHLHQANTHDLAHYLKHPWVYSSLFLRLAEDYDDEDHAEALRRLHRGNKNQFENFPLGDIEPKDPQWWLQVIRRIAKEMKRGDLR